MSLLPCVWMTMCKGEQHDSYLLSWISVFSSIYKSWYWALIKAQMKICQCDRPVMWWLWYSFIIADLISPSRFPLTWIDSCLTLIQQVRLTSGFIISVSLLTNILKLEWEYITLADFALISHYCSSQVVKPCEIFSDMTISIHNFKVEL